MVEGLTRAHVEGGPGLAGGPATVLIHACHALVALGREVGSRGLSLEHAEQALARLVEGLP